jgi:hypothetical protein
VAVTLHSGTAKEILLGAAALLVFVAGLYAGRYRSRSAPVVDDRVPEPEAERVAAPAPHVAAPPPPEPVVEPPPPEPVIPPAPEPPPVPAPAEPAPRVAAPAVAEAVSAPPVAAPAPRPGTNGRAPAQPRRAAAPPSPPLFVPRVPWPQGSAAKWRCEIAWQSGYRRSEFRAMATPPGGKKARQIGTSPPFKNLLKDPADIPRPELIKAVEGLMAQLEDQGWTRVARGGRWYNQRFVWEGAEPPLSA